MNVIDQEMDLPIPKHVDHWGEQGRGADVEQALAAIIATTRRDWLSPRPAESAADETMVERTRIAHPLIRFALDAKRSTAWRARIGRQAWIQSVVQLGQLDRTPEGTS